MDASNGWRDGATTTADMWQTFGGLMPTFSVPRQDGLNDGGPPEDTKDLIKLEKVDTKPVGIVDLREIFKASNYGNPVISYFQLN